MKKKVLAIVALATTLFGSAFTAGCKTTNDYLEAYGTVVSFDGAFGINDLNIDSYDWNIRFKDGVQVTERFFGPIRTNAFGEFTVTSGDVNLGYSYDSCYFVCDAYDEFGYCLYEIEVCDTYFDAKNVSSIDSAYSSINYYDSLRGYLTTYSEFDTYPIDGRVDSELWVQDDIFVTDYASAKGAKKAHKPGKPGSKRTFAKAKTLKYSEWKGDMNRLSSAQRALVAKARVNLGIEKNATKTK